MCSCSRERKKKGRKERRLYLNVNKEESFYIGQKLENKRASALRLMVLFGCVLDMLFRHDRTPAGSGLRCGSLWYVHLSLSLIFSLISLPFLGLSLDIRLAG